MNCNTCRYQLSQCLDGRLPSGQRAVTMQHVERCAECERFWSELQAAQALTLRLRQPAVGSDFREGLWERIHAGEGTPEAVFREVVPLWTKVRYAATGAAAAAAVLLGMIWLRHEGGAPTPAKTQVASANSEPGSSASDGPASGNPKSGNPTSGKPASGKPAPGILIHETGEAVLAGGGLRERAPRERVAERPAVLPLTLNLVATETARQLEERHAAVSVALRRLQDPDSNQNAAIADAIEKAEDFRILGEMLLDLRDAKRVYFTDNQVYADLRVAVKMLGQRTLHRDALEDRLDRRLRLVENIVVPAMQSPLLGHVSRIITTPLSFAPEEDVETVARLNLSRPEVFSKLFRVLGYDDELSGHMTALPPGRTFMLEDPCGLIWVTPLSEVSRDGFLRLFLSPGGNSGSVRLQVELPR